jgi:predicted RNA-binding protein YlxR (DUF448 family)
LVRLVRTPEARVLIDPTGKRSGRGAYLCDNPACWQAALKRGLVTRALKLETAIAEDDLQTLHTFAQRLGGTSEPVASPPRQP